LNNYSRGSYRQPRDERMSEADKDALHGLLGRASFVAFDFETTGLDAQKERIVEIGAVRFSLRERGGEWELATGEEYASLVNPGRPIPSQASAIHGISDLDVSFSPSFKEAAPDFLGFLGESVLVAHNAPFDLGFLAAECERAGLAVPLNAAYDTKLLAKTAVPHLPSYSLKALSASFGIAQQEAHRGADDARVCMELFARCVRLLFL
jgi:DNA polymerase III subunit epsilon